MKIVLWIANEANQRALANKIHASFPISGIVTESKKVKRKITATKIINKIIEKIFLREVTGAWWGMKKYQEKLYPEYPDTKIIDVSNINSETAFNFTKELQPDLIVVSGTRMIKKEMLALAPGIGIMNLHTGLSPYIKGGPNCTNWCISTKQYHLIGNTVMWIDAGIDSGNIITTEFTEFNGTENLLQIHIKVMEHAHNLYMKAINWIAEGKLSNVKQDDIAKGITYYSKEWKITQQFNVKKNISHFRKSISSGKVRELRTQVKTVILTDTVS